VREVGLTAAELREATTGAGERGMA
jgi:hypothetical protein